jgi:hypothetical protein
MAETKQAAPIIDVEKSITDILSTIEREREREIIARRFGLFDRRETLEQIGELLGITRERVRQLEKVVIIKLRASGEALPHVTEIQSIVIDQLHKMGEAARISDLTAKLIKTNTRLDQSRVAFLATLCPQLTTLEENDLFYLSVGVTSVRKEKQLKADANKVVDVIKKLGEPTTIDIIAKAANITNPKQAEALASISKQLATLNGRWGLVKWPMVNPKNIRDKIYVVLKENGKQMHFSEIAEAIKKSDFKRKAVTTQAIHNELIKDSRFVLIGRGIYALNEWGYKKGTVADIITEVIKEAGKPLHRDEIVKRVLKSRIVKETTVLLNLQGKSKFKRVAKATYDLADTDK